MPPQVLMLLAGFGIARAWDLVVWMAGLSRERRRGLPRRAVAVIARDIPDLLSDKERSRLRHWLEAVSWSTLASGDDEAITEAVLWQVANEVLLRPFGDGPILSPEDSTARQRAAAVLASVWQTLLEDLDDADLFAVEAEMRRRDDQRRTEARLRRLVDDHADLRRLGVATRASVEQLSAFIERLAAPDRVERRLLTPRATLSDPVSAGPCRLLSPRYGLVPFTFRDREYKRLLKWAAGAPSVEVSVVTGPAGVGKTRLAVEICDHLEREGEWLTGFLRPGVTLPLDIRRDGRPLLVVLDYAELRVEAALGILAAALRETFGGPVRLMLLMRNPASPQDPLNRLRFVQDEIDDVVDRAAVMALPHSSWHAADRRRFGDLAASSFAAALRRRSMPISETDVESLGTPLELSVAALLRVRGDEAGLADPAHGGMLEPLLRHEQRYWEAMALGAGLTEAPDTLAECVALAALTADAVDGNDQLVEALRLVDGLADASSDRVQRVARWLRAAYPGEDGAYVARLQPDTLAESLIARVGL